MSAEVQLRAWKGETRPPRGLRFGAFELDLETSELRRSGVRVKLQLQPFRVLALLARNPGRLLTREEIQREIWPDGTFVDFEQALNFCIRQVRATLGDQAATPRYIETLPRRGYRFLAPVEVIAVPPEARTAAAPVDPVLASAGAVEAALETSPRPARRPAVARRAALSLGLVLAVAVGAMAHRVLGSRTPPPPPHFERISFGRGYVGSARFIPEGQILYTAAWEGRPAAVFAANVASRESRLLDPADRSLVGASRTGEVAYLDDRATLVRARLDGGPAKRVLERVRAADWAADASEFAVARSLEGGFRIEYPVGTALCEAIWPTHVRLSPRRDRVAFLEHPTRGDDRGSVVVAEAAGGRRALTEGWASLEGLAWSPDGREVWFTGARVGADSALHAVALDGQLRTVVPALGRLVLHDVASDGRVLLERTTLRQEVRFRGPEDAEERDLSWLDLPRVVALSPDGRQLVFSETGEGGGPEYAVYLRRTDGTMPVRLGHGRAVGLSPDGRFVLSIPVGAADHIDVLPTGAGETRVIRDPGPGEYEWAAWLPDGQGLLYTRRVHGLASRVFRRDLAAGPPRPVTPVGVGVWSSLLSPDGSTLAAACGPAWCLYPVAGGEPRPVPDPERRIPVAWGDAGVLYVRDPPRIPARIYALDTVTGRARPWRVLEPADRSGVLGVNSIAITPDGRSYAYSYARQLSDLYVVSGLR